MSAEQRALKAKQMRELNERMRTDVELKARTVAGAVRARQDPAYKAMQALTMADVMSRPENKEKARQHACRINRDPDVRERQWAGRVANGKIPTPPAPKPPTFLQLLAREAKRSRKGKSK